MKLLSHALPSLLLSTLVLGQEVPPVTVPQPPAKRPAKAASGPFITIGEMQAHFFGRFQASPGFGASRRAMPDFLLPSPDLLWSGQTIPTQAPDLIGLEEGPASAAYVAERGVINIATMSRSAARARLHQRPLTAFETNAVAALQSGQDLVVSGGPTIAAPAQPLLVLGALRARANCCSCHGCAEGKLLGAFSYVLTPPTTNTPTGLHLASAGVFSRSK